MREALEREVIAQGARGFFATAEVAAVPSAAFLDVARLLAWTCVKRALRGPPVRLTGRSSPLDTAELFARVPEDLRDFTSARLARPEFENAADAKTAILRTGLMLGRMRAKKPSDPSPFHAVRLALANVPRLELPADDWAALLRETRAELDLCERVETFDPAALTRLLALTTTTKG